MGLRNPKRTLAALEDERRNVLSAALTVAHHRRRGELTTEHVDELQRAVAAHDEAARRHLHGA